MSEQQGPPPPGRGAESLPDPPWRGGRRSGAPARAPLTREAIVDAALQVLDRDGLDGLSMRAVAGVLGAGAGSLYWHVRNKGELLQLIGERLAGELELPPPDPARWRDQLRLLARQLRSNLGRHRDGARITLGLVPIGPSAVRFSEWLFQLLTPVGIPDRGIAYFADLAAAYIAAFAFEETLRPPSPTGEPLPAEAVTAMFRAYLLSLPVERFPHVHRAVDELLGGSADDRFEFGLDILLDGLAALCRPGP